MRVVAVDQGTSSTRAFVLDVHGTGKIVHTCSHRQVYPKPGWVEQDPLELLDNVRSCLAAAGAMDAIGIANQGESCLAWDAQTGEPVSPVIVWQDRRTEGMIAKLKARGVEEAVSKASGLPLDPYFSASKLGWIMKHNSKAQELYAQGRLRLGTTDAYFLDRLSGHFATDITTASRTSLMNLQTLEWDPQLCEIFGVPLETLPEIRPTMADFGGLSLAGRPTPITASVVDQQASLYGHGCRKHGDAKITFGTGAFALALTDGLAATNDGLLPTIAWQSTGAPPVFALEGGVFCAGSAINWARSLGLFSEFSEICDFEAPTAISRNLAFVPALTGLGCPHWDGSAAGMWIGMTLETSAQDLVQAILEGIALRTAEVLDAMASQAELGDSISIDGGLSDNPYFCQFLSDMLQKEIVVPNGGELTARGTAQMAMGKTELAGSQMLTSGRCYQPHEINQERTKFKKAVSRAKNWNPS